MNKILITILFFFNIHIINAQLTIEDPRIKETIEAKIKNLGEYISVIGNKDRYLHDRQDAIESAIKLFVDEERIIEVSSISNRTKKS